MGESSAGGLLTGRLSEPAGASSFLLGATVAYSNDAETDAETALLHVDPALFTTVGAVSAQAAAAAMAVGARERFGSDVGIRVAVPGGGSDDKPVGLVHLCVVTPQRVVERRIRVPGNRSEVRARVAAVALHLLLDAVAPV